MQLPDDLRGVVGGERVIWSGKPRMQTFVLKNISYIVILTFFYYIYILVIDAKDVFGIPLTFFLYLLYVFTIVGLFYIPLRCSNTYYIITENRIISRKGVIGKEYKILKLELAQEVNVNKDIFDKIFNTGTNVVRAAGIKPFVLENLERPMEVRSIIEEQTHNIRRL